MAGTHLGTPLAGHLALIANQRSSGSQLLLRVRRYFNFSVADVFNFDGCSPFNVAVFAIESNRAGNFVLVFGELAVFDPEFHRAFGVFGRRRTVTARAASASEAE